MTSVGYRRSLGRARKVSPVKLKISPTVSNRERNFPPVRAQVKSTEPSSAPTGGGASWEASRSSSSSAIAVSRSSSNMVMIGYLKTWVEGNSPSRVLVKM
jgi:hypothetical protein